MSDVLRLDTAGISVFAGQLFNHDYLWFSSFEIARTTRTAPIVHNFALSYAISGYTYGIYRGSLPAYDTDLAAMNVYTTPARPAAPHRVNWTRFTQNAIDSRTSQTKGPEKINSPVLGWRVVLNPCSTGDSDECGFKFYAFVRSEFTLPNVIRLGKKGCPVRLRWRAISSTEAFRRVEPVQPTHAVNPLDVQGKILSYEPVPIPPHLVFRAAEIADDWFLFDGSDRIHLPRRFTPAGAAVIRPVQESRPRRYRKRSQ